MKKIIFTIFILLITTIELYSQSGIKFAELAVRIDRYFDKAFIDDLHRQLPHGTDYTIWGWDVGDYSGDGYNDIAISLRLSADRQRQMQVYLFVDIEGYLTKVAQYQFQFMELPLEIGIVIDDGTCYVTQKYEQFHWTIRGYVYDNGTLIKRDVFTTSKVGDLTYESYRNFYNLRNTEKILNTRTGMERFGNDFMTIPSYHRGRLIYKGFANGVFSDYVDYVHAGAYYWSGKQDLSYSVSSAYDNDYIYFTIKVYDDIIVIQNCDTCIADFVEVWLDVNNYKKTRYAYVEDNKLYVQSSADSNIFCFSVYPGNFVEEPAYVKVRTNAELNVMQKMESRNIVAVSNLFEEGYIVRFKIPFAFLGLENKVSENQDIWELGCTVVAHDYDNEFRPEEKTEMATSSFNSSIPATYGTLLFVPFNHWYGDTQNIFKDDIYKILSDYGF